MNVSMIRHHGYSLLEVLVALVIISIGVLGIAAMQATALAGTHSSQSESLAAIEARSLADAMLANGGYWASAAAPTTTVTITYAGSTPTISNANLSGGGSCLTSCTAQEMAAADLNNWANEYINQVPTATDAKIDCNPTAPPVCTIQLDWTQKTTAISGGTQSTTVPTPVSYVLVNQF
jgi:type IV pilus assembly protein PilV